jgi:hypothetical protein
VVPLAEGQLELAGVDEKQGIALTDMSYRAYRRPPVPMKDVVMPNSVITPASGPDTCWPMFTVSRTPGQT